MDYNTFLMHYEAYDNATSLYSYTVMENPDFRAIVNGGTVVIPYILKHLQEDPSFGLITALHEIEPSIEIPPTICGKLHEISKIMVEWGKQKNYI